MNTIGKSERASQDRMIKLFQTQLGYTYFANLKEKVKILAVNRLNQITTN